MDHSNGNQSHSNAIPVGIAVARQRLQEHAQQHHQPKDLNRYGIGVSATDLGEYKYIFPFIISRLISSRLESQRK